MIIEDCRQRKDWPKWNMQRSIIRFAC